MEEIRQIYFNEGQNQFIDELGYVIYNIYSIIDPNMIYLLKTKKEDLFVYGVHGEFIELIYETDNLI